MLFAVLQAGQVIEGIRDVTQHDPVLGWIIAALSLVVMALAGVVAFLFKNHAKDLAEIRRMHASEIASERAENAKLNEWIRSEGKETARTLGVMAGSLETLGDAVKDTSTSSIQTMRDLVEQARNQISTIIARMLVPARFRKISARTSRFSATFLASGHL